MRINIYKSVVCLIVALLTLSFTAYGGERSSAHAAAVSQEANRATPGKSPDFTLSDAQLEVIGYCIMNLFEYPVCSEPGKELLTDKSVTMLAHWIINDNFIAEFNATLTHTATFVAAGSVAEAASFSAAGITLTHTATLPLTHTSALSLANRCNAFACAFT